MAILNRKSQLDTLRFGTQFPKPLWPLSFAAPKWQHLQDANATTSQKLAFYKSLRFSATKAFLSIFPKGGFIKFRGGWTLPLCCLWSSQQKSVRNNHLFFGRGEGQFGGQQGGGRKELHHFFQFWSPFLDAVATLAYCSLIILKLLSVHHVFAELVLWSGEQLLFQGRRDCTPSIRKEDHMEKFAGLQHNFPGSRCKIPTKKTDQIPRKIRSTTAILAVALILTGSEKFVARIGWCTMVHDILT